MQQNKALDFENIIQDKRILECLEPGGKYIKSLYILFRVNRLLLESGQIHRIKSITTKNFCNKYSI